VRQGEKVGEMWEEVCGIFWNWTGPSRNRVLYFYRGAVKHLGSC